MDRNGSYFIAYKGDNLTYSQIYDALNSLIVNTYDAKVNVKEQGDAIFAKIVINEWLEDREPDLCSVDNMLTVSGYEQRDAANLINEFSHPIPDPDIYHKIFEFLYLDHRLGMFRKCKGKLDLCTVIYPEWFPNLVAGVVTKAENPVSEYSRLYAGIVEKGSRKDIVYSNHPTLLRGLCYKFAEIPKDSFINSDGIICNLETVKICEVYDYIENTYNFGRNTNELIQSNRERRRETMMNDGRSSENKPLIPGTTENVGALLQGINALLGTMVNESAKKAIEEIVNEYLNDGATKEQVLELIESFVSEGIEEKSDECVEEFFEKKLLEKRAEEKLYETLNEKIEKYLSEVSVPVVHSVYLNNVHLGTTSGGFYHEKFEQILRDASIDEAAMLIGPAGSGKNVAVSQVAKALGLKMYYTNNATNEFKLTGFIDAGGTYRETEFYKAFKDGGLFFLDEIDNSDPSALIVINSALANGYMAFPHETIERHKDFRIIAAANTWGKGSDLQYVGRNALDAATLDRFDNIFFDYDRTLEKNLYPDDEVLEFMWAFRDGVNVSKIPHIVSTRGIGKVYKKKINNFPFSEILTMNVVKNLTQDDVNMILSNMDSLNSNHFYSEIRKLRLR